MYNRFAILFLVSLMAVTRAAEPRSVTHDVAQETYGYWKNCLVMRGGDCKAVVVPGIGGRMLNFSLNGENILFDNPDASGLTLRIATNFWASGYQLDLGPELRGIPRHDLLWRSPWSWRVPQPFAVHLFSDPDPAVGLQLEKEFVIDPDTGELGLTQRMRNITTNDVSYCLWDRTHVKGGGFALIPLSKTSRFKAGWAIRVGRSAPEYRYDGDKPRDPRVRITEGALVAEATTSQDAPELKLGADSEAGWIAYACGKILFVKYFPVFAKSNYSDGGNTVEFSCNDRAAELAPLSPEANLKPGGTYSFPEKWVLIELEKAVTSHEQARALVKRIPKSPFAK
jgi:hypothetical protein